MDTAFDMTSSASRRSSWFRFHVDDDRPNLPTGRNHTAAGLPSTFAKSVIVFTSASAFGLESKCCPKKTMPVWH